eukprot:symbB.v1.2.041711.t1/scaffold8537.1/size8461/1
MADQTMIQMLQVAAQAAQAASEAADSMRKMVERDDNDKKQKFSEASKVVRMPDSFGSEDQDQDQKGWRDFLHNFKSWLYYADGSFEAGLSNVDQNPKDVLDLNAMEPAHKAKSIQLYAILSGLLKGKPLRVLRQQEDRNGLEVYRQLVQTFTPSSRTRSLSLLQALMQFPQFTKDRTFTEQILSLERLRSEYQRCAGQDISDDLALSILVKFVVSTGYREVRIRCDSEPATLAIMEATIKTCRILGIQVTAEPTAVGNHEANGGAERTVELVRSHANILVTHLESCCGADRQVFGCDHPIYSWALVHSAWLHNRFKVTQGQTPYERACGRMYSGRLAQFGERVMAYLRQEKKADPKWLPAIWLGKTLSNDCHVLCEKGIILVSRSIRRLPDGFNLEMLGSVESAPWDHGLTSLGHKLIQTRRQHGPGPLPAMAAAGIRDKAADDPPSEGEVALEGRGRPVVAHQPTSASPVEVGTRDMEQGEIPAKAGMKPPPFNAVISGEVEMHGPSPSAPSHVNVPSTPVIQVGRDDLELEASERPAKQARTRDVMAVEEKHEDEMLEFHFQDTEVEMLEEYDETLEGHDFESYEFAESPGDGMKDLIFPYTPQEPELAMEEMSKLDIIADKIEVERLKDMGVLIPMDDGNIEEMKSFSTRFVRTWRDKIYDNNRVWLRRSRLVAREYSWLADRSDLFSPASNAISGRLLQLMFLRQR